MSIRITELDAITSLQNGDYIAVDNESTGTHKFDALNIGSNIGQNIANTYSSSASYAIGQYCLYDNNLYKCTTTISTPEAWNSSHWIQVTVGEGLYEKVDKVSGKGLSTNDFTDEYKQKLGGIEAGAEVNVQANWAETNTSSDSYIQNKPGNATTETSGFMSASDKQKLNGIANGAEVNVQANWAETDSSKDDYIKNKPTIDDTLSTSSTNAVENSAIATAINNVTQLVSDEATARENAISGEATARENADIAINEDIGEINTTLETKANIDGSYQEMTVGSAEQLLTDVTTENSKIYTFRTTGGNIDVGDRKTEQLIGGTIAWNQLSDIYVNPHVQNGITTTFDSSTGDFSLSNTSTASYSACLKSVRIINNHVYYQSLDIVENPNSISFSVGSLNGAIDYPGYQSGVFDLISKGYSDKSVTMGVQRIATGSNMSGIKFKYHFFDLTQMFGSTIADALYAMEQAEAGTGVAWFKNYFPKSYYAYDAGSLQSVNIASGVNTGFNQWDEEWESGSYNVNTGAPQADSSKIRTKNDIRVLPNTIYYKKTPSSFWNIYLDADKNPISYGDANQGTFTTPSNCYYIRFNLESSYGTTYNHDICINIRWDGERDGEYEPYNAHIYNYDSSLQLRGIPSLDEFNNLVYDGDVYSSDGTVQRKYGIVDLGTLIYNNANNGLFYSNEIADFKTVASWRVVPNMACAKYTVTYGDNTAAGADKTISAYGMQKRIFIKDSAYSDSAALKSALSGQYLVYELATPTEESADPYQNPQIINDWGTEEWVDAYNGRDFLIPPGHNTQYMINLKAKLEMSPNSPDGDGEYIVRQTNNINEYIPFSWVGEHEDLIAGGAQQLISDIYEENSEPYLFRTSGGSIEIGDREYMDAVVGGTVAWNQYIPTAKIHSTTTVSENVTSNKWGENIANLGKAFLGHKILTMSVMSDVKCRVHWGNNNNDFTTAGGDGNLTNTTYGIYEATASIIGNNGNIGFRLLNGLEAGTYTVDLQLYDLTQMFGSTVADYIYSLEQSNAGAGVAWFKKYFPKPYYAYNAGELKSVSGLVSHDMVGFNAWDEETADGYWDVSTGVFTASGNWIASKNYIPILPNTQYYIKGTTSLNYTFGCWCFYDADKNFIEGSNSSHKNTTFTTPNNAHYMTFYCDQTYRNTDICINISWDASRDGEYEPYELHSYPLDSDLTLRGIPKLDANNNLYYDGDTYGADGSVSRKYGVVDLGSLNWNYDASVPRFYSGDLQDVIKKASSALEVPNALCPIYQAVAFNWIYREGNDKGITVSQGGSISVKNASYTDTASFKTAMSGVYLVYELATPTTESADPYTSPQIVNDFGTEEFVISNTVAVPIPVGHNTRYTANLKAKLEMAPDSPNGDGDYIVRQSNGINTYVPLVIEDALPATPTTNGTYKLIATVTNGEVVLSWGSNT